jgi:hypothetical protein
VRSRRVAPLLFNALPAEAARRKQCVPRFAPINVLIAMDFYLHSLLLIDLTGSAPRHSDRHAICPDAQTQQRQEGRVNSVMKPVTRLGHVRHHIDFCILFH